MQEVIYLWVKLISGAQKNFEVCYRRQWVKHTHARMTEIASDPLISHQ